MCLVNRGLFFVGALTLLTSCGLRQAMYDQPKYKPHQGSSFYSDGQANRPPIEGTVARGHLREDRAYFSGKNADGSFVKKNPRPVNAELLARGKERFGIYCSVCHAPTGDGGGMVVQRGYKRPSSYHVDRLRAESDGYFYDVITNGFGVMPNYKAQVAPDDRWAIVAYIRALQLSQNMKYADLTSQQQDQFNEFVAAAAKAKPRKVLVHDGGHAQQCLYGEACVPAKEGEHHEDAHGGGH